MEGSHFKARVLEVLDAMVWNLHLKTEKYQNWASYFVIILQIYKKFNLKCHVNCSYTALHTVKNRICNFLSLNFIKKCIWGINVIIGHQLCAVYSFWSDEEAVVTTVWLFSGWECGLTSQATDLWVEFSPRTKQQVHQVGEESQRTDR